MQRISIHVATRDRHSEVACLLVSLRNQTYQDWDIVIVDESETPLDTHVPSIYLLNRIRQEGHKVYYMRNIMRLGVCHARNICIDQDHFNNPLALRLDDDVVPDIDYIEKLVDVIDKGYDIASGVTPLMSKPEFVRDLSNGFDGIVNRIDVDNEGNITKFCDDCGYSYDIKFKDIIQGGYKLPLKAVLNSVFPAHCFRSCALYKTKITKDGLRYETSLSPVSFREESFFSLRARWEGYKIGVDLSAKVWHFITPSGGCRYPNYQELVRQDDESFRKWLKKMIKSKGGMPK